VIYEGYEDHKNSGEERKSPEAGQQQYCQKEIKMGEIREAKLKINIILYFIYKFSVKR
jgi:hypothetical protein